MTDRERFLQTMAFGMPDRVPYQFGWPRESTFNAWYLQGLPRDLDFRAFIGDDHWGSLPVDFGPVPQFEEVTLEETNRYRIWIDSLGAKRLDHKTLPTPGFVTRTWLEFPVKNRADWLEMKKRYDPSSPRLHARWNEMLPGWRNRDYVLGCTFASMFWRVRDWVGFESLCRMFYDDPMLVHEMMEHVCNFTIEVLDKALDEVTPDYVLFNEDMAYKTASMISPAMVREFMMPRYIRLCRFFREKGVPVLIMDCDGFTGELIPLWLEAGINALIPVEIAANNDPIEYRKLYGRSLALIGGIDKRELRFDKTQVHQEVLSKVPWLMEQGGYIPQVDHGVPPDVSVRNYLYMVELIKLLAQGVPPDKAHPSGELEAHLGPVEQMWSPEMASPGDEE